MAPPFPFTAVVGADDLRLALCLAAVSPTIGGVLVRGEKGTAKSTVVRALTSLLPPVPVVGGCRFSCEPWAPDPGCPDGPHDPSGPAVTRPARLVELPVGASEDRLVGALDLERALTEGVKAFEPGLLAAAHRGLLYVDEVNLLPDALVDTLLDAAALGRAHVEREGVSVSHAARFVLVGTMNPEEGELRPQLLDRFGLTVEVVASRDPVQRAEVVRRRLAYDDDPEGFGAAYVPAEEELARRIAGARRLLPTVVLPDRALRQVTAVCASFDVDGLRGDLVTARTALALAAWEGRTLVDAEDVRRAALLALPHRRRRGPFDAPGLDPQQVQDALDDAAVEEPDPEPPGGPGGAPSPTDGPVGPSSAESPEPSTGDRPGTDQDALGQAPLEQPSAGQGPSPAPSGSAPQAGGPAPAVGSPRTDEASTPPGRPRLLRVPGVGAGRAGRRSPALSESGRTIGVQPDGRQLHPVATMLAAAPAQQARGRSGPGLVLRREDLRRRRVQGRESNLVLFCVDASGSMAAKNRMQAVKGAVLALLTDAYQRRDVVGLVTFRGDRADLVLPPTSSVHRAADRLGEVPTGGRTPLAAGLLRCADVLRTERLRDPRRRPLLVVVTDGRATGTPDAVGRATAAAAVLRVGLGDGGAVVLDCEAGPVRLGLAGGLAAALGGDLVPLDRLTSGAITRAVGERAPASRDRWASRGVA